MLQNKFKENLPSLKTISGSKTNVFPFSRPLSLFFYLPDPRRETLEPLIQFFQKYHLSIGRLQKGEKFNALPFSFKTENANFLAQSVKTISPHEFQQICHFLISNVIVVALVYQNQVWNFPRLHLLKKNSVSFLPHLNFFNKNLLKIAF